MHLPEWMQDWLEILIPGVQIFLIIFVAWLINWLIKRIILRAGKAYDLPHELLMPLRGVFRWIIIAAAILAILERLGMSATVLWTAFTSFATVGAVAFFAAWSVLSNLFCALLIVTVSPFRLGDYIEVLDTAEKPGAKGRVIDINMLYTTLQESETEGTRIQIPNTLVFQRVLKRWSGPQALAESAGAPPSSNYHI